MSERFKLRLTQKVAAATRLLSETDVAHTDTHSASA